MSKLENIILRYGNAVLDLPKTNDPIGKPVDEAKQDIKDLMLELIRDVDNPYKDDARVGQILSRVAKKVKEL